MKHVALHVIIIKAFSSNREYAIIQKRIFDDVDVNNLIICIDIESEINFINENFLLSNNLYEKLKNCSSITVRDINDERIMNKQINFFIYIINIQNDIKLFNVHVYVSKNIEINVILSMNELKHEKNDIIL